MMDLETFAKNVAKVAEKYSYSICSGCSNLYPGYAFHKLRSLKLCKRCVEEITEQARADGPGELPGRGEEMCEIQERVINAVLMERTRQDAKWGEQNHQIQYWTGILGEEYGELCEAINETVFDNGSDKGGYDNMRTEAIHVAAVAIGFLECLERNKALWFPSPAQGDRCVSCGEYVPEGRMVCQVCEDDPSHALRKAGEREVTGRYGVCRGKIQETL